MTRFSYTALAGPGRRVSGTLTSRDRRHAVQRLLEMGYHPTRVETETTDGGAWTSWTRRVRAADLAVMTRQLAALLKAGMPIRQALETLQAQCAHRRLAQVVGELHGSISRDGATFSEAIDGHPAIFDNVYRGLVRSGEEGGTLDTTLHRLADQLGRTARLRGLVVGAFIYPLFLLVLGVAALFVLMAFVIPRFATLFATLGQSLPWPTRALIAVSTWLDRWWWAVLVAALIVAAVVAAAWRHEPTRRWIDRHLLRLPVLGTMLLQLEVARMAHTLAALLSSGVRILDALGITAATARNRAVRASFAQVAESVRGGRTLADAVAENTFLPPMLVNLIRTGEETGTLPDMLGEASQIYEQESSRGVDAAVKLLEPALIVIMGLAIAGIIAAVILPVFQSTAVVG